MSNQDDVTWFAADLGEFEDDGAGICTVYAAKRYRPALRRALESASYDEQGSIEQVVTDAAFIGVGLAVGREDSRFADIEYIGSVLMGEAGCRGVWLRDDANQLAAFVVVWS